MSQYLLSVHTASGGETHQEPMTPEQMQAMMKPILALEAEMTASGAFVFSGRLAGPDAATVVRASDGDRGPEARNPAEVGVA